MEASTLKLSALWLNEVIPSSRSAGPATLHPGLVTQSTWKAPLSTAKPPLDLASLGDGFDALALR
jgi:hypothetical protein